MAWLHGRAVLQTCQRTITSNVIRCAKKSKDGGFIEPLDLATGLEKREMLAAIAGNDDPYYMKVLKRSTASTKESPNLVPSAFESRIIGCVCQEEASHVVWMWLHEGAPRRCECGHWFKLIQKNPL